MLAALGSVEIRSEYLIDGSAPKKNYLHGTQHPGRVTVNEAPSIVGILLHELINEVRPDWSEHAVRTWTPRLQRQMSPKEIQAIYEQYKARKL